MPVQAQEAPYKVHLTGVEDDTLRQTLEETSSLFQLAGKTPPSIVGLRRRAQADQEQLMTTLRSAGYYDGSVKVDIDSETSPVRVSIRVQAGPRYRLDDIAVVDLQRKPLTLGWFTPETLGLHKGAPARAPDVVRAESNISTILASHGFPRSKIEERQVVVDHSDQTMDVTYVVEPGPLVRLGAATIEELEQVNRELVQGRIAWKPGDIYDPKLIDQTRTNIADLNVFQSIRITPATQLEPDNTAPVVITVSERPRRFFGATANYSTSEAFGGDIYWGHRNVFGGAEQFRIALETARLGVDTVGDTDIGLRTTLTKPDFLMTWQSLLLEGALVHEQPEGYERDAVILAALLSRPVGDLTVDYGVTFEQARILDNLDEETKSSTLFGFPVAASLDRTDNLLNPTTGFRSRLDATPYVQTGADSTPFVVTSWTNSAYYDASGDGNIVLAGRVRLGMIPGTKVEKIPADKRFYAGGGGSIRGYEYQTVGPLNEDGEPIGGRSLFEINLETRFKVTDTIGLVPFVDGGNVYETIFPDFAEEQQWAAGLGVRYYTQIGPLRADVAFPLNRRKRDAAWQFYISIGQAF